MAAKSLLIFFYIFRLKLTRLPNSPTVLLKEVLEGGQTGTKYICIIRKLTELNFTYQLFKVTGYLRESFFAKKILRPNQTLLVLLHFQKKNTNLEACANYQQGSFF